jgi:hypothetical protein
MHALLPELPDLPLGQGAFRSHAARSSMRAARGLSAEEDLPDDRDTHSAGLEPGDVHDVGSIQSAAPASLASPVEGFKETGPEGQQAAVVLESEAPAVVGGELEADLDASSMPRAGTSPDPGPGARGQVAEDQARKRNEIAGPYGNQCGLVRHFLLRRIVPSYCTLAFHLEP